MKRSLDPTSASSSKARKKQPKETLGSLLPADVVHNNRMSLGGNSEDIKQIQEMKISNDPFGKLDVS